MRTDSKWGVQGPRQRMGRPRPQSLRRRLRPSHHAASTSRAASTRWSAEAQCRTVSQGTERRGPRSFAARVGGSTQGPSDPSRRVCAGPGAAWPRQDQAPPVRRPCRDQSARRAAEDSGVGDGRPCRHPAPLSRAHPEPSPPSCPVPAPGSVTVSATAASDVAVTGRYFRPRPFRLGPPTSGRGRDCGARGRRGGLDLGTGQFVFFTLGG